MIKFIKILVLFALFHPLFAESFTYQEKTDDVVVTLKWEKVILKNGAKVTVTGQNETHIFITDGENRTLEWQYEGKDSLFVAKRVGDFLTVTGKINGEAVNQRLELDERPWYQLIEFGLHDFILNEDMEEAEFWVLRQEDLELFTMLAEKEEKKEASILGEKKTVIDVTVSLSNLPTFFWSVSYTFATDSGQYVGYRGKRGGYGVSETVVTLVKAEK